MSRRKRGERKENVESTHFSPPPLKTTKHSERLTGKLQRDFRKCSKQRYGEIKKKMTWI